MPTLPRARGRLSALMLDAFAGATGSALNPPAPDCDEDAALTLWMLRELSYRGFDGVDERWEWHPDVVRTRVNLESDLEAALRSSRPAPRSTGSLTTDLLAVVDDHEGPSLARYIQQHGTRDEADQMLRQRSVYHLKEADPTSWVIARLPARPKAALLEIQADEYGNGNPARLHHQLFAAGMGASGLDAAYGAYIDEAITPVLQQNAAMSMLGMHRRLRGAALGHLAAFEATSSLPSRQLAQGLDRLGFAPEMVGYYDEHVEADAVHEQLALRDVCGALVEDEPDLWDDVLFGAWVCLELDARVASALLTAWRDAA